MGPGRPVVGASGAIVGLIGLLLAYGFRSGSVAGANIRSAMMQNALLILFISILPGVSFLSHAGGFVGGLVAGFAVPPPARASSGSGTLWQYLSLGAVFLVLLAFYNVAVHGQDFARYWQ